MTVRQVYEYVLININKTAAPNILLADFNYFCNTAIYMYINKRYNVYDVNQQSTDDMRVLKATAKLPVQLNESSYEPVYEVVLPNDYLHILNCICDYEVKNPIGCYKPGKHIQRAANRLTADLAPQVISNYYMRKKPYFYINNVNTSTTNPTNPYNSTDNPYGTDITSATVDNDNNVEVTGGLPRTISIGGNKIPANKPVGQIRYGNPTSIRMEIRYGEDYTKFGLQFVYVDYLKVPQTVILTQEQLDLTEDTSQIMEFPDYVCQEIIKELVTLLLENSSDTRLQTYIPISSSVANPAQQST